MFIVQCCQNNRIVGYSAMTAQQASTTSSSAQVTTGQNTDVGTPPTALEEEEKWKNNMTQNSEVRIRKSVKVDHETTNIVCFQMNDSLHGSLHSLGTGSPACFLDDGDGDSDLLPEEDEDEDQDQQQQCTNNTCTAAARTYNMITLPSSKS